MLSDMPHGLSFDRLDGSLLVADAGAHAVFRFSTTGHLLQIIGTPGKPSATGIDYATADPSSRVSTIRLADRRSMVRRKLRALRRGTSLYQMDTGTLACTASPRAVGTSGHGVNPGRQAANSICPTASVWLETKCGWSLTTSMKPFTSASVSLSFRTPLRRFWKTCPCDLGLLETNTRSEPHFGELRAEIYEQIQRAKRSRGGQTKVPQTTR